MFTAATSSLYRGSFTEDLPKGGIWATERRGGAFLLPLKFTVFGLFTFSRLHSIERLLYNSFKLHLRSQPDTNDHLHFFIPCRWPRAPACISRTFFTCTRVRLRISARAQPSSCTTSSTKRHMKMLKSSHPLPFQENRVPGKSLITNPVL